MSTPDFRVVIPARYASSRLPGKPLLPIGDKPMIQWVVEVARNSGASEVLVATDDQRIAEVVSGFGDKVVMTRPDHASGTDRIAEVILDQGWSDDTIVVNLQGDEPLMPPELLGQVAGNLATRADAAAATLCVPIEDEAEVMNPGAVKVVTDRAGFALYFSRASIPWDRDRHAAAEPPSARELGLRRHLGIYAYRASTVLEFVGWPPAPIEEREALEQLRLLWNGRRIHVDEAKTVPPPGVDTAEDLEAARRHLGV